MDFTCLLGTTTSAFQDIGDLVGAGTQIVDHWESAGEQRTIPDPFGEPLRASRQHFDAVAAQWTRLACRSRRRWRTWGQTHPELAGLDPFAPWQLRRHDEREAFVALTLLAGNDEEALSAWCAKSASLWHGHWTRAWGRRGAGDLLSYDGASLAALCTALNKIDPATLATKPRPFDYVMSTARSTDRSRRRRVSCALAPAAVPSPVSDGMDGLVEMLDAQRRLVDIVHSSSQAQNRSTMHGNVVTLLRAWVGEGEWATRANRETRHVIKRRSSAMAQAPPHCNPIRTASQVQAPGDLRKEAS